MKTTPGRSRLGTPSRVAIRHNPTSKVRVVAKVRPFLDAEIDQSQGTKPQPCIRIQKGDGITEDTLHITDSKLGRNETYNLDFCYGEEDDVGRIFLMEVHPILPLLFQGCNATIFAYGATGSGKTYTMQGKDQHAGLMPLALTTILSLARTSKCIIEVSYYEVYMDRCYDLLDPKVPEVSVLEDWDGQIQLRGLTKVEVHNIQDFHEVFSKGCLQRKVGKTGLNDISSRSHGVLMVSVTTNLEPGNQARIVGKLNLIDLAGNEDNRRTGNEGIRLAESSRINQSLFVLSNVINALNANESRVPYRDSKLTRILQDSLGGTSCALMIACLNPGSYQEASFTLSLAAKSRQIVNKFAESKTNEESQTEKVDMGAKLRAWQEAKSKVVGKSPAKFLQSKNGSPGIRSSPLQLLHNVQTERSPFKLKKRNLTSNLSHGRDAIKDHMADNASSMPQPTIEDSALSFAAEHSFPRLDINTTGCTTSTKDSEKENVCQGSFGSIDTYLSSKPASPPVSVRLKKLGCALREVLSPMSSNLEITKLLRDSPAKSSPQDKGIGERTPSMSEFAESPGNWTPLAKFHSTSHFVQNTLVREYIDILNRGTREELLALKGIGEKRADYLLELREVSDDPIKELRDLEKIGLSAKHAQSIFNGSVVHQILEGS